VKPKYRKLPKRYSKTDIINYIIGANLHRRDLDTGQRGGLILECYGDLERAEAKERMRAAGGDTRSAKAKKRLRPSKRQRIGRGDRSGDARERLAKRANISGASISRIAALLKNSPALYRQNDGWQDHTE
jgi:hypothetical protein